MVDPLALSPGTVSELALPAPRAAATSSAVADVITRSFQVREASHVAFVLLLAVVEARLWVTFTPREFTVHVPSYAFTHTLFFKAQLLCGWF